MRNNQDFHKFVEKVVGVIPDNIPDGLMRNWVNHPMILDLVLKEALGHYPMIEEIQSFAVEVRYSSTIEEMVSRGEYTGFDGRINSINYPHSEGENLIKTEFFRLVRFSNSIKSDKAIGEMSRLGIRPVTIREMLVLGAYQKDSVRYYPVVGLGTEWFDARDSMRVHQDKRVVCLTGDYLTGRILSLERFDDIWGKKWVFAGVDK